MGLICVNSTAKFLRAGYANVLLFIGAVFGSISRELLLELGFGRISAAVVALAVFLVFVVYYSTFISRISEEEDAVFVLKALSDIQIPIASITTIRISVIGLSHFAKVTIELDSGRTHRIRFIAPSTNIGTFKATIAALEKFARRHSQ